jgi:sulfur relay (sulfurtransferase) complex TusBCD TusD component (DsrE family)
MNSRARWIVAVAICMTLGLVDAPRGAGESAGNTGTAASISASPEQRFKLGLVLTQTDPETVFNVFRVAQYALEQGDEVSVFLLGKAVELDRIQDATYNVQEKAQAFLASGGRILACGTCLQMHGSTGSKLCPISTMQDLYELIRASDRVLTF